MFKVLIVDDEPWIVKDMRELIEWEKLSCKIVGEAYNGTEAEMMIKSLRPDIVISDIRMPGMNGLDLIEKIGHKYKDMITIFISAYNDFSYAQSAISNGAFDYILKPVETKKMEDVVLKACRKIKQDRKDKWASQLLNNTALVHELLENNENIRYVRNELARNGFTVKGSNCYACVIKYDKNVSDFRVDYNAIESMFENLPDVCFVQALLGYRKWLVLVSLNEISIRNLFGIRRKLRQLVKDYNFCIGISSGFSSLESVRIAYEQADLAIDNDFFPHRSRVYFCKSLESKSSKIDSFLKCINEVRDIEDLKSLIASIPDVAARYRINSDNIARVYNNIVNFISLTYNSRVDNEPLNEKELISIYENLDDMVKALLEMLEGEQLQNTGKGTSNNVIKEILDDIGTNFNKKIELSLFAEKYFISSSYLSQLFKQETGKSFTNYLIELRLNKAVELLKNSNLTLYEISDRVGYDDCFHFSKLFKKYKGISPTTLRKNS